MAIRTVGVAATVTVIDALLALPVAFFMAKVVRAGRAGAARRAVLVPLWAGYLVKGYAWKTSSPRGVVDWVLEPFGLHGPRLGHAPCGS